ncbi:MAG: mannonate dehydratase [Rhodothermales bacterium]|jgi:mannonate dehydratase
MRLGFRWYGPDDAVGLGQIRQIPAMTDLVTSLHDVPPGVAWTDVAISARQRVVEAAGMTWTVVESIPVPESIKLGAADRDIGIEAWCSTLVALGEAGIGTVCYNFMPVFDWLRTDLYKLRPDGSTTLAFAQDDLEEFVLSGGIDTLPAWAEQYTPDRLKALLDGFARVDTEQLWANLAYFLERVVPVAERAGVRLAIHPDDPPWPVFGLPRIVTDQDAIRRLLALQDSAAHGLTFCTGSLGSLAGNDLVAMAAEFGERTHFVHARNVRVLAERSFEETAHPEGDVRLPAVLSALAASGFTGTVRPDHGRMIWGETGRVGYGLFDRALGAAYIKGILDAQALG